MPTTVPDLLKMSQVQLDQLFTASTVGNIPDGPADGTAIVAADAKAEGFVAELVRMFFWQGKVFNAANGTLKNRILFGIEEIEAKVYKNTSWFDGKECIVLDYSKTSTIAHSIRDEIRMIGPGTYLGIVYVGRDKTINFALQFPAKA